MYTDEDRALYPFTSYILENMAGSSQPQHFFAAECVFADFAIAVIFWVLPHSDIKFEGKNRFCKYAKNYPKFNI